MALTLKVVCGFSVREIASAFLVGESTIAQRITRAKRRIAKQELPYEVPTPEELPERLSLHAVSVAAQGDVTGDDHVWTSDNGGPYTSTPVAYRGRVFYARYTGIFNVLDLRTGENLHRRRLDTTIAPRPSPVTAGSSS